MAICRRMRRLGPQQWSFSAYFPLRPRFVDEILKNTHDHRKNLRKPFDFRLPKKFVAGVSNWRTNVEVMEARRKPCVGAAAQTAFRNPWGFLEFLGYWLGPFGLVTELGYCNLVCLGGFGCNGVLVLIFRA
ncbi:hypothetical protein ES319_A10G251300v1 [Gossypium barbadense]|uniref:Uncharacterized protein n=2 Tax=Gossypium TaxID=3633 RepID=A0A5J5UBN2_GOSBA|nr:hypothetical protein ES319_A10G251300v1 [Gossypium barbadense]TYH00458.1 hypothetical protein ES288_A10G278500v1 [Gossypium darwinii]